MKVHPCEGKPSGVSETTRQDGEAQGAQRWGWVERAVWTDRMLEALDTGVKGGVWYSLVDKVWEEANLRGSFKRVKKNRGAAGVDHVTIARFERRLEKELRQLGQELREGSYRPRANRRTYIEKPGTQEKRPLGIACIRDRVVQSALKAVIEPIFEHGFGRGSFGFRPQRCQKDALRQIARLLQKGYRWVVDADIRAYFDSIPRDRLKALIRRKIADGRVLEMLESFLEQPVMEDLREWTPEEGTPQGAVISPLLANIYLDPLDHLMEDKGFEMVRYADDLVILCRTEDEAERALEVLREWMESAELELHPTKTRLADLNQPGVGFDFLGYHFETSRKSHPKINRWPTRKAEKRLKEKLKPFTRKCNGHSMEAIITRVNPIVRGWFEYFKHSRMSTFTHLDGWLRGRLRTVLRKRRKRRGRARGADHQRWPNSWFHERGLFSMAAAYVSNLQSLAR